MSRPHPSILHKPANDSGGLADRAPVEPRSFAPGFAEARARWPAAWETVTPERPLPAPDAPDGRQRDLVMIPCLNEGPCIAAAIAEILDDDALVDPLVVVVDTGSTDGSPEIVSWIAARDPRVRLVQG